MTDREVRSAKPGAILNDGGGLRLIVSKVVDDKGKPVAASWQYRYWTSGIEHRMGLGVLSEVSLARAREKRDQHAAIRDDGTDPIQARKEEKRAAAEKVMAEKTRGVVPEALQLEHVIDEYHRAVIAESGEYKSAKHVAQWRASLQEVIDTLGPRCDVTTIADSDLFSAISPIAKRAPETAARVTQRITDIFGALLFDKVVTANPALPLRTKEGRRKLGLLRRGKGQKKKRLAALHYADVPSFVVRLNERASYLASTGQSLTAVRATLFALLTAARTSEVLLMEWTEVSMKDRAWVVPAHRMKMNEEHLVPLSDAAMSILEAMKGSGERSRYVFPSSRSRDDPMSQMALLMVLRRVETGSHDDEGIPIYYGSRTTMHGLARATFSTWANEETDYKEDVIEVALAHSEEDRVKAAYDRRERDSFANDRRQLLQEWATYVLSATKPATKGKRARGRPS